MWSGRVTEVSLYYYAPQTPAGGQAAQGEDGCIPMPQSATAPLRLHHTSNGFSLDQPSRLCKALFYGGECAPALAACPIFHAGFNPPDFEF